MFLRSFMPEKAETAGCIQTTTTRMRMTVPQRREMITAFSVRHLPQAASYTGGVGAHLEEAARSIPITVVMELP